MASEVKANKLSPATGTALQISDSGDTTTIPSGATLDVNGTLDVTGATVSGLTTGKVLQIVYTSLTTASSTSSSTYSGTNLPSVSITPTSTSNYLWILATLNVGTTNNAQGRFRIYDGSTQYAECKIGGNFQSQQTIGMQAIFQAPSTSSQTYSVQRKSDNALAVYVNEGSYNTVVPSVITIVEYSV